MLKEPLIHFLAIGIAVFARYGPTREPEESATGDRIVVTGGDNDRLSSLREKRWQRPPPADMLLANSDGTQDGSAPPSEFR